MKKKIKLLLLLCAIIGMIAAFALSSSAADVVVNAEVVPESYNSMSVDFSGGALFITSTQFYLTYNDDVLDFNSFALTSGREGDFVTVTEEESGKLLVNFFTATHAFNKKMFKINFDIVDTSSSAYGFNSEIINMYRSIDNTGADSSVLSDGFINFSIPVIEKLQHTIDPSEVFYNEGPADGPTYNTLKVYAVWSNGATFEIPQGMYTADCPFYNTISGFYQVNIAFKGVTNGYTIAVGVPLPEYVTITKDPDRMSYLQDSTDEFDKTGMVVEAYYPDQDPSMVVLYDDEYSIDGFDTKEPGIVTVYITAYNRQAELNITIEPNVPSKIEIATLPDLTVYKEGSVDELLLSGLSVKAYFDDMTTRTIPADELTVSGFDPDKIGEQTITVTFRNRTTTFKVKVEPLVVYPSRIEIDSMPIKLTYFQDSEESLVTTGLKVRGYYDDGTVENLRLSDLVFTGFDTSVLGTQTITVSYFNISTSFDITIEKEPDPTDPVSLEVITQPSKKEYIRYSDEQLDLTGLEMNALLANGETIKVPHDEITYSGFNLDSDAEMIFVRLNYKNVSTALLVALIDDPNLLIGDVDRNGTLTAADARLALRISVSLENNLTSVQRDAADFNRDTYVTASDARSILRVSVGLNP